ncbi:MAG: methyltransferase family protein [Beijerinckiaceae bacterium]
MQQWSERPNTIHWPPILYGLALLLPWLLAWVVPLPFPDLSEIVDALLPPVGWALVATGVTVGWLAIRSFAGAGTPFDPTARAETLVTFGLYNRTRNPMYLAALIAFFGLALATDNLWRLIAVPLLFVGLEYLAVVREEAHLAARFGDSWREYAGRVSRWW